MYDICREFEGVEEEEILPASLEDPAAAARAAFFLASNAASFPELSSSAIYERASSFENMGFASQSNHVSGATVSVVREGNRDSCVSLQDKRVEECPELCNLVFVYVCVCSYHTISCYCMICKGSLPNNIPKQTRSAQRRHVATTNSSMYYTHTQ